MVKAIDKLIDDINTAFTPAGAIKPIISRGGEASKIEYIPTASYAIGYLLGTGGWPKGKLIELFGPEHAGKTTLCYMGLMDCFNYHDGKKAVAFIDIEHRFNPDWAEKIGLVKGDNLIVVQPPDAERATDAMTRLIKSGEVCAIGFDSIGSATTSAEQQEFADQAALRGGNAAVMSRNVGSVAPLADLFGTTCFYINQIRADMEGYHRIITPGGHKVKHMMSVRMYVRRGKEKYFDKETGEQVGFPMVFKTVKNSFGPSPREQYADFYFEASENHIGRIGFDTEKELAGLGLLTGVVEQSSSWYYYGDVQRDKKGKITGALVKGNGRDNFFAAVAEEGLQERLAADVMSSLSKALDVTLEGDLARPETDGPEIDDPEV